MHCDCARSVQVRHLPRSALGLADASTSNAIRPLADKISQGTLAAIDPNLSAFTQHGGKLLMYHGWTGSEHRAAGEREISTRALEKTTRLGGRRGVAAPLHGPGHGALRRQRRAEHVRHDERARAAGSRAGRCRNGIVATHSTAGKVDRTRPLLAPTRRSRDTPAPAASTTPSTSCAGRRNHSSCALFLTALTPARSE